MDYSRMEYVIDQIAKKANISKKEIQERVKNYINEMDGMISQEGALSFLIKELKVTIDPEPVSRSGAEVTIRELIADTPVISVVGKVTNIFPIRTFTRKNGTEGKVVNIIIADKTGEIRAALWDADAEKVERKEIKCDQIIEIQFAYVKKGYQGGLEIALGRKGKVNLNPKNVNPSDFPSTSKKYLKIAEITQPISNVSIRARITSDFSPRSVTTKDGRETQILNLDIADETGSIVVPIWENNIDQFNVKDFKKGDKIEILYAYAAQGFQNRMELRIGSETKLILNPTKGAFPKVEALSTTVPFSDATPGKQELSKVKDIDIGNKRVYLILKCLEIGEVRIGTRKDGSDYKVSDSKMADETGTLHVPLWDDTIDKVKVGKTYKISNGYVSSFQGNINLNIGRFGEIEEIAKKLTKVSRKLKMAQLRRKRINDIQKNDTVELRGSILRLPEQEIVYKACPNCNKKVPSSGEKVQCERCKEEITPNSRMRLSFRLDDGFGDLRVTLFDKVAEKLLNMSTKEAEELIQTSLDKQAPIIERSDELIGKEITVKGRIRFRDNIPDMVAQEVESMNLLNELNMILERV